MVAYFVKYKQIASFFQNAWWLPIIGTTFIVWCLFGLVSTVHNLKNTPEK